MPARTGADVSRFALGCVALIVVALLGLAAACNWSAQRHLLTVAQAEARHVAESLAAVVSRFANEETDSVRRALAGYCSAGRVRSLRWIDAEGAAQFAWPPGDQPAGASGGSSHQLAVTSSGGRPLGTLVVGLPPPPPSGLLTTLFLNAAFFVAVSLVAFVLGHRGLRRQFRPLEAIEGNLVRVASGVEKELRQLALSDAFGQVATGWNQIITQITELQQQSQHPRGAKADEEILHRFEARKLRLTMDRLPHGVLRLRQDRAIVFANLAAAQLLGRSQDELTGACFDKVVEDEALVQAIVAGVGPAGASVDRKRGEGQQQITLRFTALPGADNVQSETVVLIQDVSHVGEAEKARDSFLYHVTHELRTPLTNIQAYAETLTKPAFDDEQTRRECYNVIISETRRLSRLVEDILSISQLEVGSARVELDDVDLAKLVRQVVQDNLGAADEKHIDLTLKLPPKVPKLRGDKQRLAVLLGNLIGNAIKYTPGDGRVDVGVDVSARGVQISVADTGIGVAASDQSMIFEKFYRAANDSVQAVPGTGLGLAIAREVARLHGGDIRVKSELGKGSTFTVELPRRGSDGAGDEL